MKNIQYLLFRDRLVGGLRVGLRCRSKNGVNVDINKRKQLRVERSGGFTELPIDPVLGKNHAIIRSASELEDKSFLSPSTPPLNWLQKV